MKNESERKIIIKQISVKQIHEAVAFHNDYYKDKRTTEQWKWEYMGMYPDKYVFTISEHNGRIIGTQAMIPININISGKIIFSGKSENTLVDPQYRGIMFKDMYTAAMEKSKENDMVCVWGYTVLVKVWGKFLDFFVDEEAMFESFLILNVKKTKEIIGQKEWTTKKRFIMSILTTGSYIHSSLKKGKEKNKVSKLKEKYTIESKPRNYEDLQSHYARLREKCPNLIHLEQDEKYLSWRVFNNPNVKYTTHFLYEESELRGYCYLTNKNKLSISDFSMENQEVGIMLIRQILDSLNHEKHAFISYLGNEKNPLIANIFSLLKQFGFIKRKNDTAFVIKNILHENDDIIYDTKNWYLSGLWTEGYAK